MEVVHIIIVIIILYFIYDIMHKPDTLPIEKNATVREPSNVQQGEQIGPQMGKQIGQQIGQQSANNYNPPSQYKPSSALLPRIVSKNIMPNISLTNNSPLPNVSVDEPLPTAYDPYFDSNVNPYTGEVKGDIIIQAPADPSYDISDRDILSKVGRDTVQGFYVHKNSTNEMLWMTGGSL